jgi:hypothetical protein
MPKYTADPTKVTTALAIFPKGDVELKCGKPKAFERQNRKGEQSYGIRIPVECVSGPSTGKRSVVSLYMHSDGAQSMAKRFQMAMAGMLVNDANEKAFDANVAGLDWSFDTDTGECGAAWAAYEGNHIVATVDVSLQTNDKGDQIEQQDWKGWLPFGK